MTFRVDVAAGNKRPPALILGLMIRSFEVDRRLPRPLERVGSFFDLRLTRGVGGGLLSIDSGELSAEDSTSPSAMASWFACV